MFQLDPEAAAYGVTAIENRFILDYLPAAKGDFVKVYLFGLYLCQHQPEDYSLEDMARELSLTVEDIEAALRYWERRALVSRVSDNPPAYRFYSPTQRQQAPDAGMQVDQDFVAFTENVYAAFGDKRKVNPGEIALAWEWVQDVGLPMEAVLMLLQHCLAQHTHFSFKKAEKEAIRMKEAGVATPEDAESFLQHNQAVHDGVRKVLSRMGKRRLASDDELALYEKWIRDWGFDPQAVLDACAQMTGGDPSFRYLDSILDRLRREGQARTSAQVQRQLAMEKDERELAKEVFDHLGAPLSGPAAIREYRALTELQPHAVVLLAADECRRVHKKLEDLHALLLSWKERGLTTEADALQYLNRFREANRALRNLFDACGHQGRPTAADRTLYEKWRGWGFDQELLLFAAEQARVAEGSKIGYLDKVLDAWHQAGITTVAQAQARKKPEPRPKTKTVSAQQYTQREYTEEELSAASVDLIEEAKKKRG